MVLYNVTINIEHGLKNDWLLWMKEIHIPEMMETGLFTDAKIWKVITDQDTGFTYSVQYVLSSMADYNIYITQHAPELKQKFIDRYGDKALAFRTLLEAEHQHG